MWVKQSAVCLVDQGCETLASERSTNLAVRVGEDVQLKINPPVAVFTVGWYFRSLSQAIVTWNGFSEIINPPYQGRVELNKNTGTLTLKNVSRSDSGDYLYQAVGIATGNPVEYNGIIALNVYLTEPITNVNVKPSLAQPIANQTLNLTCQVLGSQTVSSRLWLKDGQPLSTSDRITLSVDSSVVSFNPVLQSDNGEYQCKASNPLSEVTSAGYRLEVYYGPEQISITGPDHAVLNSSVTFTCSAQSMPPCNYTWYFNGIETAQESQYEIASVSNADSGSYTCVAWNSVTGRNTSAFKEFIMTDKEESTGLGSLTSGEIAGIVIGTLAGVTGVALGVYFSVKLCRNNPHDLKPGPAQSRCETLASERSTNLAVGVGEDVQLKINPPVAVFSVTWYFGSTGVVIVTWNGFSETVTPPYQGRVELNRNTGTLTLKNVSRSDSGDYLYQAVSIATGHPIHYNGNIALNVYQPITNVNVKPSLAQPIANQTLNLTCEVLGSQTVSSRLWLKDGQPLSTSDRITLSVDSSVVSFNPVLQSDNGEYQCKASNPVSEVTSAGYRLEVYYGPEQASITAPDSAAEGSSITFTCSAQSMPPCNYTWYFNGTETAQGSQYKIASFSNADRGSYTCVAWNSVTGRKSSAVKEFIMTEVFGCVDVMRIAQGRDSGVKVIFYYLDNNHNERTRKPCWVLAEMKATHAAVWSFARFVLIHVLNKTVFTAQASVPISNVAVTQSSPDLPIAGSTAVNLTCEVSGLGVADSRLWMMDGHPLSTNDRITLSVDNNTISFNPVLLSDNGTYQCTASNLVSNETGAGYKLIVNYGPEEASIMAPDLAANGSAIMLTCSARSQPPSHYTWYLNGKQTANGSQYMIDPVSTDNQGNYTCVAWNSVTGRNSSAIKELSVIGSNAAADDGLSLYENITPTVAQKTDLKFSVESLYTS
ncbi:UNVERIFIED_CONTAM: hypothetical protein FKN15_010608 [Acipenser sinensis]